MRRLYEVRINVTEKHKYILTASLHILIETIWEIHIEVSRT